LEVLVPWDADKTTHSSIAASVMALHGGKTVPPDFRAKNDKELYGDSQVEMLNIYLRNAPQVGRRD
jgi:hypothetical protein